MKQRTDHKGAYLGLALGVFLFALTLKNTEIAANGIKKGLGIATNTLIPALFPFLVFSNLALQSNALDILKKLLARPAHFFFGLSENGTVALLLGWLCGLPIGTVSAITMLKNEQIGREEFDRLFLFSGIPGTGFLIGAVGTTLFGSQEVGFALLFAVLLSSTFTGILLKLIRGNITERPSSQATAPIALPFHTQFTAAVRGAFSTVLEITGFVLFFSAVAECVKAIAEAAALPSIASILAIGLLELTSGIYAAVLAFAPEIAFCLCAFFAGFSGLSICLQLFSIAVSARPKIGPYLLAKLSQGVLSFLFAGLYLTLRKPILKTTTDSFFAAGSMPWSTTPIFTCSVTFLLLVFFLTLVGSLKLKLVTFLRVEK